MVGPHCFGVGAKICPSSTSEIGGRQFLWAPFQFWKLWGQRKKSGLRVRSGWVGGTALLSRHVPSFDSGQWVSPKLDVKEVTRRVIVPPSKRLALSIDWPPFAYGPDSWFSYPNWLAGACMPRKLSFGRWSDHVQWATHGKLSKIFWWGTVHGKSRFFVGKTI